MDQPPTKSREFAAENEGRTTWPDIEPVFELPRQRYVYAPPRPLPSVCAHETLDMTPVRLAPEIDPRQAATILSLRPVQLHVLPEAPRGTSWVATALGVSLLIAVAVLPGTLVWLLRTHRVSESMSDLVAGAPRHGRLGPEPAVTGLRGKGWPVPSAAPRGQRGESLRARPIVSTEPSSRPPMAQLGTGELGLARRR